MTPPVYDCLYLACAERLGADLVTADERFAAKAWGGSTGVRVYALSEFGGVSR